MVARPPRGRAPQPLVKRAKLGLAQREITTGSVAVRHPVAVEILLADWIPRKIIESPDFLRKAPDLLRAFIRFCHAEREIRPELTDETLAAVNKHEPEYQRAIRSARPQGPMALLAAMGSFGDDKPWEDELSYFHQNFLDQFAEEVGGQDSLDSLATPRSRMRSLTGA